ncbi:hypothetical protein GCM10011506_25020 [Marivirga lumbricoides]|uniref:Uncharacterized protein n=1 Tax=Marivirga lumbricoides TaxID=1046115 RepID=A0ABQ1MGC4_9BACT|nr:hypothetical protein GCM10011506_25020 [Marivirga lumbricoides]
MHTTTIDKEAIIEKLATIIEQSEAPASEWKIGIANLQRISLLNVNEEIHFIVCDLELGKEVLFNFIAQGVQTCKMSKANADAIYLYR